MKSIFVGSALLLVIGCGNADDDNEAVDQHQSIWETKQPLTYVIEICDTGEAAGCSLDAVSQQQVVAARSKSPSGSWSDLDPSTRQEPVAGLFREARSTAGCKRTLTFDGPYGFVSDVYFDCGEEGWGAHVACFVAGSVDPSACPAP